MWPSSRMGHPKQFIDLFGTGRTQLQQTFDRIAKIIPLENIFVTTNDEFQPIAREQLPMLPEENFLGEPVNRNTAPSVTWGCYRILSHCADANVIIIPSDQAIIGEEAFERCMNDALDFVSGHDGIIAMGVRPSRPEPGYGYIQMGDESMECHLHNIKSFSEKPEREFAQVFMDSGEFLWNTGIFVSNVRHLLHHSKAAMPAVFKQIELDGFSFDNANIKDEAQLLDSNVILENCTDNIIKLPKGRLGVFSDLDGYIVVENENVLMVCKKSDSSAQIRKFVNEVQVRLGEEFI